MYICINICIYLFIFKCPATVWAGWLTGWLAGHLVCCDGQGVVDFNPTREVARRREQCTKNRYTDGTFHAVGS